MAKGNNERNKAERALRNRVARAIFAAAESMGMSDREMIEQLTDQVIHRLDHIPTLPGMEHLVPEVRRPVPEMEIQSMVRNILAERKPEEAPPPVKKKERLTKAAPKIEVESKEAEKAMVKISDNARAVLERRYLVKDSEGRVETVEGMFHRVAHHVAAADSIYNSETDIAAREEEFYQAMANLEFLPNSPTLMNAGRELGQLSACFVLPVDDSMESIFDTLKYTALIHKSGGGTGFSFSRLRPEGDLVGSTGGVASGPVSFMRAFDAATDVIKQGGKRRGANMAILNIDHPDILKFIEAKKDPAAFTNFNLSVAVTEDFMQAVEAGADYELTNPRTKEVMGKLNAKEVFNKMVDMAWRNGDPGIVFIDRVNEHNPTKQLGKIESTNPCGEQPLLPFESCNLGSINLSKMVAEDDGGRVIDHVKLSRTVKTAVRFLDNVIDVNKFPLPKIEERTKATRKIGLGIMGFADMLIKLNIPYDSEEALEAAGEIMHSIQEKATKASVNLAKEREVFPAFEGSDYDKRGLRVRNATRTTIAPTGTLSIIAGCSSGIEPLFALSYVRNILDGAQLLEVNPQFEDVAKREGFYSEELVKALAVKGSVRGMAEVPEGVQRLFVTAHDIAPEWHVKMQAAFQKETHNAVSKTINFPYHATRDDVAQAYLLAYKEGCKGITIYRDRSREAQVLSFGEQEQLMSKVTPRERPTATTGVTEKVATGCGNLYITVNYDEEGICELFASLGKAGGCASAQLEAITRLISLALRSGIDVESLIKHLKGIRCPSIAWDQGRAVLSCADAIGGVLERRLKGETSPKAAKENAEFLDVAGNLAGQCPDCGGLLIYQEGCFICPACGYTKC